jgi:hypothetical protein
MHAKRRSAARERRLDRALAARGYAPPKELAIQDEQKDYRSSDDVAGLLYTAQRVAEPAMRNRITSLAFPQQTFDN